MKRRICFLVLTVCLSAFLFAGCKGATQKIEQAIADEQATLEKEVSEQVSEQMSALETEISKEVAAKPTKDRAGNDITIPAKVNTIISMAPSVTRLLIAMGYGDKIVACDTYSGSSPYATELRAGLPQFDMMAPDNESIIALQPDIVFTTGMSYAQGENVYSAVKEAGVCVADIPSSASIDEIKNDIIFIGQAIGDEAQAYEITSKMEDCETAVLEKTADIKEKKTVLYIMSVPTPDFPDIYTCGKGTYMDEIFTLVGTQNIAGDIDYEWPAMSEEEIIAANPDVIIVGDTYTPDAVNAVLTMDGWGDMKAIKDKAVYLIDGDSFNQPNQFVMNSACEIGAAVYPDIFKDIQKPFK